MVAHPDDDLYFMNPEVVATLRAGHRVVTVYITAGESDGRNNIPGADAPAEPDQPAYASARMQGLRQAYSWMSAGVTGARWSRSALAMPNGASAETAQLGAQVTLVHLGLREEALPDTPYVGLAELWHGPGGTATTLRTPGSPVAEESGYTRGGLIDAIAWLLERYRPGVVHYLDPLPDHQSHDAPHRRHFDQPGFSDHRDHTVAAKFVLAALSRDDAWARGRSFVQAYRGYYNARWPANLSAVQLDHKVEALDVYGGLATSDCGNPGGCGDYSVGQGRSRMTGWAHSVTPRWDGAGPALTTDAHGRVTAFWVLGGSVVMSRQQEAGERAWTGLRQVGGHGLLPVLAVTTGPGGSRRIHASRVAEPSVGVGEDVLETGLIEQSPQGEFHAWRGLWTPDDPRCGLDRLGVPAVAVDGGGNRFVFARQGDLSVAVRTGTSGQPKRWIKLADSDVRESLAAVTDVRGMVHLFGSGRHGLRHWAQSAPGALPIGQDTSALPVPVSPPAAVVTAEGALVLAFRCADGIPCAYRRLDDGGWRLVAFPAPAEGGLGPVALAAGEGHQVLLVQRTDQGALQAWAMDVSRDRGAVRCTVPDVFTVGTPSAAMDGSGRFVLAGLGIDGSLLAFTETETGSRVFERRTTTERPGQETPRSPAPGAPPRRDVL
ncbi:MULTISPECIES: PIG-L family deacetylase [unclassified Streptomyces]|uniref:PIG-L family deacetylase n=1 Tax=unclassified Streptomyces TaxID=2593676 RepID=UPI0037FB4110